jgi:DNA-binding response OmpR family regulator
MARTILVVDDEAEMLRLLDYSLTKAGYLVIGAKGGEEALGLARRHSPDLVVLDVMMPGMDGFDVCRRLRADPQTSGILVLMLTARAEEEDRVVGLELGADDYMTKPFGVRELLARVKGLLRRTEAPEIPADVIQAGPLVVDAGRRTVAASGKEIPVTCTEFELLRALLFRRGKVLSREDLIEAIRGGESTILDRTVDVHVASLRRKLGKQGALLETVRGVGYRFRE